MAFNEDSRVKIPSILHQPHQHQALPGIRHQQESGYTHEPPQHLVENQMLAARTERIKGLFGESGRLEKQIEKQLATLTALPEKGRDYSSTGRDRSPQRSGE